MVHRFDSSVDEQDELDVLAFRVQELILELQQTDQALKVANKERDSFRQSTLEGQSKAQASDQLASTVQLLMAELVLLKNEHSNCSKLLSDLNTNLADREDKLQEMEHSRDELQAQVTIIDAELRYNRPRIAAFDKLEARHHEVRACYSFSSLSLFLSLSLLFFPLHFDCIAIVLFFGPCCLIAYVMDRHVHPPSDGRSFRKQRNQMPATYFRETTFTVSTGWGSCQSEKYLKLFTWFV